MLVTLDNYQQACQVISRLKRRVCDLETTGLDPYSVRKVDSRQLNMFPSLVKTEDQLCGVGIGGDGQWFYFPFRHISGNLPWDKFEPLIPLLCDPEVVYTGFNYAFDLQFLFKDGVQLPTQIEDVMIAAHLLNENEPSFKLKELADKYLGASSSQEDKKLMQLLHARGLGKGDMWKLPARDVEPYACDDLRLTDELRNFYLPALQRWGLDRLWREYNDYCLILTEGAISGLPIDVDLTNAYLSEALTNQKQKEREIHKSAGKRINLNSSVQLQKWLGLQSTASEPLEELMVAIDAKMKGTEKYCKEDIRNLLEYRAWGRAAANYYGTFLETMCPRGRLHAQHNLIGTVTGRLSIRKPPLQAIPRQTEIYKVKDVFVADEGMVLCEVDYSQAEIRVACHYGREMRMAEKLARGADIHSETASEIQIPRQAGKTLNFSVIYGIGAQTLSARLGCDLDTARSYLNRYHSYYPGFRQLYRQCADVAETRGYIRMFSGRLRHYNTPTTYTHKASSNLIQGAVAEMVRIAITRLKKELGIVTKLQVHDSMMFQLPRETYRQILPKVKEIVEDTPWCSVRQKADIKTGDRWGTLTQFQEKDS